MTNRVIHYQRKRRPNANFSVEFIFADVRRRLAGRCEIASRIAPYFSNGLIQRLQIVRDVRRYFDCIVHVTGDINFAILGTTPGSGSAAAHASACGAPDDQPIVRNVVGCRIGLC